MAGRRLVCGLLATCALGLAPAVAHADGWVTVSYSGTLDQTSVYDPSNPTVQQGASHFAWNERQVFHLTTPDRVTPGKLSLQISGQASSTYAPPNALQSCSFSITARNDPQVLSPLNVGWTGSGPVGAGALLPITGDYAMSTGESRPGCGIPRNGSAGLGPVPPSMDAVYAEAKDPSVKIELGRPAVTRHFDAEGRFADGSGTASLHATLTVSNSAREPAGGGGAPPTFRTPARQAAKLAALDALKATLQAALYPCGVGAGIGTALAVAGGPVGVAVGGTMSALGTPLCLAYLKTIKAEADTVADPPRPAYRTAATIAPVRTPAAKLPACPAAQGAGSAGAVCAQLTPAAQKLLSTARATSAAAAAIDVTMGRETAAMKAGDRKAVALQERTLAALGRGFSARRAAEAAAAQAVAQILRAASANVTLDPSAANAALSTLVQRLGAAGLPAAKLTTALGGAPQVTAFDLLTSLGG